MKNSDSELLRAALSRRAFLGGVSTVAGLSLVARYGGVGFAQTLTNPRYDKTPFKLGVASGDPWATSVVLWTRLCPEPLLGGGMPAQDVSVRWEIASDEGMKRIVQQGTATATAALGHSVHVEVENLRPFTHYWYRFESGGVQSPVGRTKTLPDPASSPAQMKFAFASCQQFYGGYYTAYQHMATQDLDFVSHLGDYIYEGRLAATAADNLNIDPLIRPEIASLPKAVRPEPMTLAQYRLRYSLYKLDPNLQATHAAFPWIVTWDDHEVENNYAAGIPEKDQDPVEFLKRRAAAYQAYYEFMPLRRTSLPHGPDLQLYRRFTMGDLMQFNVLDTRQYRSDQAHNDKASPHTAEDLDPSRVLMGKEQAAWLTSGMSSSKARWNVMAQQIIMSQFARHAAEGETFGMDSWDGYSAERSRLMQFLNDQKVRNPITLSGDSHTNLISDLKLDFNKPESPIVGVEFAGTSITSGGYRAEADPVFQRDLSGQPHLKWFEGTRRGYVSCTLDRKQWHTNVWQVEDVRKNDSNVKVGSSWVVEDGKPGVQRA
ncbi:alkaline phosphatase [bacterium]|nr:MAG: alkaline phosphatase [bacterium]